MPRRDKSSKSKDKGPPGNHPSENYREHRAFLIRSLERNDVDMAALMKLNSSLHVAKEKILQTCGELVLLDLGCGKLKLFNDELHEQTTNQNDSISSENTDASTLVKGETNENGDSLSPITTQHHLTPAQKKVCVDFLLRMKLRRKLCNRLIRRLNRIATAMDGKDVSPPPPPRYGDLRLHIDPEEVENRALEWKQVDEAKKRITAALNGDDSVYDPKLWKGEISTHTGDKAKKDSSEETKDTPSASNANEETRAENQNDFQTVERKSGTGSNDVSRPTNTASSDQTNASAGESNDAPNVPSKETDDKVMNSSPPTLESDYEFLRQFDDAYEKYWDPDSRMFKYLTPSDAGEPEYMQIKNGAGIGASNRGMTLQDREAEHKRWQTNVLARIPDQPTFEELGLAGRVFYLEDRRKRCLDDVIEGSDDEEISMDHQGSPKKPKNEAQEDQAAAIAADKRESNASAGLPLKPQGNDEDTKNDIVVGSEGKKNDASNNEMAQVIPKRPISLAATPSFHEQDLHRVRVIHHDVVKNTAVEAARNQLASVTNEYNNALRRSTECFNARHQIQHNLTFLIAKGRQDLTKAQNEYASKLARAKLEYIGERRAYDEARLQKLLPSKKGISPEGTPFIARFMQNEAHFPDRAQVAGCLADVIDVTVAIAEGAVATSAFKDFVAPPMPGFNPETGEDMAKRQHRVESEYRSQYNVMTAQFQASETERAKAWRKMLKTKAELEMSHEHVLNGSRHVIRVTPSNYTQIPMPSFQGSANVTLPREMVRQSFAVASYRPPVRNGPGNSASKYSADKVRERKSADGTVAPVTEPKKTPEGLYMRPAGRTRKGMRWDAFAGVWVPQSQA